MNDPLAKEHWLPSRLVRPDIDGMQDSWRRNTNFRLVTLQDGRAREDGYNVTAYERRDKVGGLRAYMDNTCHTAALQSTYVYGIIPIPMVMIPKYATQ